MNWNVLSIVLRVTAQQLDVQYVCCSIESSSSQQSASKFGVWTRTSGWLEANGSFADRHAREFLRPPQRGASDACLSVSSVFLFTLRLSLFYSVGLRCHSLGAVHIRRSALREHSRSRSAGVARKRCVRVAPFSSFSLPLDFHSHLLTLCSFTISIFLCYLQTLNSVQVSAWRSRRSARSTCTW